MNATINTTTPLALHNYPERVFAATMFSLISIIGTFGNAMVIVSVVLSKKLQTYTNAFVVSLSVADLLTSLSLIGNVFALVGRHGWPLPGAEWFCSLCAFLLHTCIGASVYTLSAIAINRMVLITRPFTTYTKIYKKWTLVMMVAATWIVPTLVILTPPLLDLGGLGYDTVYNTCTDLDQHPKASIFNRIQAALYWPGPVVIIIGSYAATFVHIRQHFKKQLSHTQRGPPSSSGSQLETGDSEVPVADRRRRINQQEVQITQNLFLVVCLFFLCFSPYFVSLFIPGAERAALFTLIFVLANSAINPVIYAFKHPQFKYVLKKMITCRYREIPEPSNVLLRFIRKS